MKTLLPLACAALLLTPTLGQAQTALYVNDALTAGDIYTSAPGNDLTGNGSASAPYATVQRALDAAPDGSTVFVDAGLYPQQQMVLSRVVSLIGAGTAADNAASATVFDGLLAAGATQSQVTGLLITAPGGTAAHPQRVAKMTFRNYDFGIQTDAGNGKHDFLLEDLEVTNSRRQGIMWSALNNTPVGSRDITFRRLRISQTALPPNTNEQGAGRGLFVVNGHKDGFLIENSVFEENRRAGIDFNDGSVSRLIIRGCQFARNGGAAIAILGATGRQSATGPNTTFAALIENNSISNNASNGMELKACTGTGQGSGPGSFVIRGNFVQRARDASPPSTNFDNAGIAFVDRDRSVTTLNPTGGFAGDLITGGAWMEANVIRGYYSTSASNNINGFGIVLEGINHRVQNNVVTQCQYGIQVQDRPTNSSIFFGLPTPYFDIDRNQTVESSGISITQNRIDSCQAVPLRAINVRNIVNASLNWLGGTTTAAMVGNNGLGGLARTLNGNFNELSAIGTSGQIDVSPFLNSGTDVAAALGFQPDLSFLNTMPGGPAAPGMPSNLQEAMLMLTDGGTVDAAAGTYNESVTVTKNVTLTQEDGPITVRDLVLNGSGKTLQLVTALTINRTLTLTAGLISTTATNVLILADDATTTSGNAGSYVSGPLRKIGDDAFVFPIGRNGVWARIGISAPNNTSSAFTAEYVAQGFGTNQPVPASLAIVSRVEHWRLERTAGNSNVAVRLFWEDGTRSGITALPQLRIARNTGSAWVDEGNGGTTGTAASGSIVSAGNVSGFGVFSFGSTTLINPLPVELVAFRAETAGEGRARLHWTTAQEHNNRGFEIERALNGSRWQQVGFVAGAGNSSQPRQYSFLDVSGLTDLVYYRLRQVDNDGKATYSPIAAVRLEAKRGQLALFPNPASANQTVNIRLGHPASGPVTVQLLDAVGRPVWNTEVAASGQSLEVMLQNEVKPGLYLLRVSGKGLPTEAQQLVIK